ncbi:MAG: A/G-specific adenine glycosylase [Bacteroidales bacterium]|nr:A/G-specific adenine glycosylase [Bacteroidales bacterium]
MTFSEHILIWYYTRKRELPWRNTNDPYRIWLSEVILQQTRIDQGMAYYNRFIEKYPDIEALADAPEQEVLKLWQGLGYYSRARNLLFAAQQVVHDLNGQFPNNFADLKKLKGVGDYTAAAIASIAFNENVVVVDGNVKRVISRMYGLQHTGLKLERAVKSLMEELIDKDHPGDFNQAVMEFGAMQCTPKNPRCRDCIFRALCYAYTNQLTDVLPLKNAVKKPALRYFYYAVIQIGQIEKAFIVKRRSADDIWKSLYDFPLIESERQISMKTLLKQHFAKWFRDEVQIIEPAYTYKHQLTHRTIKAQFFEISVATIDHIMPEPDWEIIPASEIFLIPIPRLIERYISDQKEKF